VARAFDVDRALKAWEERFPDRGERIIVLRGMYYDCLDDRLVKARNGKQRRHYPQTAMALRAMLDAEGAA
jgi:hypothetical protein